MKNYLKGFLNKVWKQIEDELAKYLAYIFIAAILVLILLLRNWSFSKHTVELYGWLWLSIPLAVMLVVLIIYSLSQNRLKNYRRDEIFGMIWKWNDYQESTSDEYFGLSPLCPKCFHRLEYGFNEALPEFRCPKCSFSEEMFIEDFNGNPIFGYDKTIRRAHEETQRRIESGDYRKARKRIKLLRNK